MTLTKEVLQTSLSPRSIQFHRQTDSTNDLAMRWLLEGAKPGSVVIADEQLKGRGRMGRTWHTPPGVALAVSVVLHPPVDAMPHISMLGAVSIAELCEHVGAEKVGIKWPNDVRIGGLKVSGVLPEAVWEGNKLLGVVLGMGLNVRANFSGTEFEDSATSLEAELGKPLNRVDLLVHLLERVDYWANLAGSETLFNAWKIRMTTIGQQVKVAGSSGVISGLAEDVNSHGALLVRDADGVSHRVIAGDIALGGQG